MNNDTCLKSYLIHFVHKTGNGWAIINAYSPTQAESVFMVQTKYEKAKICHIKEVKYFGTEMQLVYEGAITTAAKNAYDLAVMLGFKGTIEQFLASLKGEKGDPGVSPDVYTKDEVNSLIDEKLSVILGEGTSDAIENFNEIIAFLDGIKDDTSLHNVLNNLDNRITELENSTEAQADWAENDPTSKSYVKNRTHYRIRESVWAAESIYLDNGSTSRLGELPDVDTGNLYDVIIQEVNSGRKNSYTRLLPKSDNQGNIYLSKGWTITDSPLSPESPDAFYIWIKGDTTYIGSNQYTNDNLNIYIYLTDDIKKLDKEFMPEDTVYQITEEQLDEILNQY